MVNPLSAFILTDGNTLYCSGKNVTYMNSRLRIDLTKVMEWLNENYMVLSADKRHYLCLDKIQNLIFMEILTLIVKKKKY